MAAPTTNETPSERIPIAGYLIFPCLWGWIFAGAGWGASACWPDTFELVGAAGAMLCGLGGAWLALAVSPAPMAVVVLVAVAATFAFEGRRA